MYTYKVKILRFWGAKGPGPDRFGLGGQGSWAGLAWLGGPRVLGRTGLAWEAKGPGPDRLGLGGQGSWAGPAWVLILRRTMTVTGMLI